MRQKINTGKVNYFPNRMGCPMTAKISEGGFVSYAEKLEGMKTRIRSTKFKDVYSQARLFWNSLTPIEQSHLVDAAIFEFSHVDDQNVIIAMLERYAHVNHDLASRIAIGLGETIPKKISFDEPIKSSPAVSMELTKVTSIATRKIGLLIMDGFADAQLAELRTALKSAGATTCIVGLKKHGNKSEGGVHTAADFTYFNSSSIMFDAIVLLSGSGVDELYAQHGKVSQFVTEAFKHCKTIGLIGEAVRFVKKTCSLAKVDDSTGSQVLNSLAVISVIDFHNATSEAAQKGAAVGTALGIPSPVGEVAGTIIGTATSALTQTGGPFTSAFIHSASQHRFWDRDIDFVAA